MMMIFLFSIYCFLLHTFYGSASPIYSFIHSIALIHTFIRSSSSLFGSPCCYPLGLRSKHNQDSLPALYLQPILFFPVPAIFFIFAISSAFSLISEVRFFLLSIRFFLSCFFLPMISSYRFLFYVFFLSLFPTESYVTRCLSSFSY